MVDAHLPRAHPIAAAPGRWDQRPDPNRQRLASRAPRKKRNKTFSHQESRPLSAIKRRYGAKGLCFLTSPGKLASGTLRRTMRGVSVPRAVQLSNHKLWPAIRPPATLVLGKASNPLCSLPCFFLASSITHITMDSKWYFPSFAADATDLYPRPKCHPAWVASPPRVVPFLGDD